MVVMVGWRPAGRDFLRRVVRDVTARDLLEPERARRIGCSASDGRLEVQVRAGCAAGRADAADQRAGQDVRVRRDGGQAEVRVAGAEAVAVVEDDREPVAVVVADEDRAAGGGRRDRRPGGGGGGGGGVAARAPGGGGGARGGGGGRLGGG